MSNLLKIILSSMGLSSIGTGLEGSLTNITFSLEAIAPRFLTGIVTCIKFSYDVSISMPRFCGSGESSLAISSIICTLWLSVLGGLELDIGVWPHIVAASYMSASLESML